MDLNAAQSWTTPAGIPSITLAAGSLAEALITPSAAPSAVLLGEQLVVAAVTAPSTITVYAFNAANNALQAVSSFDSSDGVGVDPSVALSLTPTGLALTFNNDQDSVTLNRLELFNPNGTPLAGGPLNSNGGLLVGSDAQADLPWQSTLLSLLPTTVGSVPVNVDGTLLLANVRDSLSQANQVWLNAVPTLNDPNSALWLNSTVQLPDGSGPGWTISQPSGNTVALGTTQPGWQSLSTDLAVAPPAFVLDSSSGLIYAASVDQNNNIWWSTSSDGGLSWSTALELPTSMTTEVAPALGILDGKLYLAYAGTNQQINITSLDISYANNSWASVYQLNQEAQSLSMVFEEDKLAIYYLGTNSNIYRTSSKKKSPTTNNDWTVSEQIPNQTASGQIVATRLESTNTTYFAYQGGTPSDPSSTIYLSASSNPSAKSSWTVTSSVPQASKPSQSGVGLTSNSRGLILSYADLDSSNLPVLVLHQGVGSGTDLIWSEYTTLRSASLTPKPSASLFATQASNNVLVAAINTGNSWVGVNGGSSPGTPALARQSVDVVLSDTINYVLGTGANAGQVLLTPAGVAYYNSNKALPSFTLSPLSGTEFASSLSVSPLVIQTTDTRLPALTLTPTVLTSSPAVNAEVASYSISASAYTTSVALSDTTHFQLGTGSTAGQVLLTAAGVTYYNTNQSLPAFTLTPSATWTTGAGTTSPATQTEAGSAVSYVPLVLTSADASLPTLKLSAFNTPTLASKTPPAAWTPVASFSVQGGAANTVYMAVLGNNDELEIIDDVEFFYDYLYWTFSADNGNTWNSWQQLPDGVTSTQAPSIAVLGGTLYLCYLAANGTDIYITYLEDAATNDWSAPYQIPSQTASYASLITENDQGSQVLSVYYVADNETSTILKTSSSTPSVSNGWSTQVEVQYADSSGLQAQTASGPLALSRLNGQTFIAYQGGTRKSPSSDVYLTSSANAFDGTSWVVQKLLLESNPPSQSSLGLSGNAAGLTLSYGSSSNSEQLQLNQYTANSRLWSDLLQNPASSASLAWDGKSTAYSAWVGADGLLYWSSGSKANSAEDPDYVFAWNDPQLVGDTASGSIPASGDQPPSLVLLNGVLTLSYIDSANAINITTLIGSTTNTWSTPYQLLDGAGGPVEATHAVLAAETVGISGSVTGQSPQSQLAVYYLPPSASGQETIPLSKAFSLTPTNPNSWTTGLVINDVAVSSIDEDFGLQASPYQGQTYLLYPQSSDEFILSTSPDPNDPDAWSFTSQGLGGAAQAGSGIGFSGGVNGLTIGYIDATRPSNLQLQLWQPEAPSWTALGVQTELPIALAEYGGVAVKAISTSSGIAVFIGDFLQATLGVTQGFTQVSAAVVDDVVYISCLNPSDGSVELFFSGISALSSEIGANAWTSYYLPNIEASSAVLCEETIADGAQLALYFVSKDGTDQIYKAYSTTASPTGSSDWASAVPLATPDASGGLIPLTSGGPLSATQHDGRSYLAFQGGNGAATATAISLLTSATPNASGSWTNAYASPNASSASPNSPADPGQATTISLFSTAAGLGLTYGSSTQLSSLQSLLLAPSAAPWSSQSGPSLTTGDVLAAPVQLINGTSIYSVVRDTTSGNLWYRYSGNNGTKWTAWSEITGGGSSQLSSTEQPSLALVGTSLYLATVNSTGQITITSTTNPGSSSGPKWISGTALSGPSASALQLIAEPVSGSTQLAVYSVSGDGSGQIYKAYSSKPSASPATWITGIALAAGAGGTPLTTSDASSLTASQFNDQTYLAFQGNGTTGTTLATSPLPNNGLSWGTQTIDTGSSLSNLDLTTSASGLNLSFVSGQGSDQALQIQLLAEEDSVWSSPLTGAVPIVWESQISGTDGTTTTDYSFISLGDGAVYWRSKTTSAGTSSWTPWQELSAATFNDQEASYAISGEPSVALWNGTVYLGFLNNGDLWLTSLTDASSNSWSSPVQIGGSAGVAATSVALVSETVLTSSGAGSGDQTLGSADQLAAYFISSGGALPAGQIGKTFTLTPGTSSSWIQAFPLSAAGSDGNTTPLSATGSLAGLQLDGQTYLAYLADTNSGSSKTASPAIVLATTGNGLAGSGANTPASNSGSNWTTQTLVDPGAGNPPLGPILLSGGESSFNLSYRLAGQPAELLVDTLGTKPPTWSPSATFTSGTSGNAALACDGDTVYVALQAGGNLFWATSLDGGSSWGSWQQVAGALPASPEQSAAGGQLSLAVLNGTLYLQYLDSSNGINVMSNASPAANTWSSPYLIPKQLASSASLITETIGSKAQLSLYYVNAKTSGIEKTWSTKPSSSSPAWTSALPLESASNGKALSSTGPLRVSQVNGQTYLAYQARGASTETLSITANRSSNSKTGWQSQLASFDNGSATQSGFNDFSLSGGAQGLTLTAITTGLPEQLQAQRLTPTLSSSALSLTLQQSVSQTLSDGISSVASVNGQGSFANDLILVGLPASSSAVSPYTAQVDLTSLTPPQWTPLSVISGATAAGPAALACSDNTFFMAAQAGGSLWWASSGDGGSSWSNWQLVPGATPSTDQATDLGQPSLAVVDGILYMSYLEADNGVRITANGSPKTGANSWSSPDLVASNLQASSARLISETLLNPTGGTTEQLSLYLVNAANQQIEKTYSTNPSATTPSWTSPKVLQSGSGSSAVPLTSAGPLGLTQVNGQTYIAYQSTSATDGTITLAANPNTNNTVNNWQTQSLTLAAGSALDGFSLSGSSAGLTLAVTTSQSDQLQAALLVPQLSSSGLNLTVQQTSSQVLPQGLTGVSLLNGQSSFSDQVLLAGLESGGASLSALSSLETLWNAELELQSSTSENLQLPPALARDGDTLYMAVHSDSPEFVGIGSSALPAEYGQQWFYWSSSSDGGSSWASWQPVALQAEAGAAPPKLQQPSLAVLDGELVLGFVDDNHTINITTLADPAAGNSWSAVQQLTGQSAGFLSLCAEIIPTSSLASGSQAFGTTNQLAAYYTSPTSNQISKTYAADPDADWSDAVALAVSSGTTTKPLTASGPLSVSQLNGQTYLAFTVEQAGTSSIPGGAVVQIATAPTGFSANGTSSLVPSVNSGSAWSTQAVTSLSQQGAVQGQISLTGDALGLQLGYGLASQPDTLQISLLTPAAAGAGWSSLAAPGGGLASGSAALALSGSMLYMAVQVGSALYWASSSNGGSTWGAWQQVSGATPASQGQPSLAVVSGTLYLGYLDVSGALTITSNAAPNGSANTWTNLAPIPQQPSVSAFSLVSETISGSQLSVYAVDDTSSQLFKAYIRPTGTSPSWITNIDLKAYGSGSPLTVSRGLTTAQIGTQTYLAFQSPGSDALTIATTDGANNNTGKGWLTQALSLPASLDSDLTAYSLNGSSSGLTLSTLSGSEPGVLQAALLAPQTNNNTLTLTLQQATNLSLPAGITSLASLSDALNSTTTDLVLAGIDSSGFDGGSSSLSVATTSLANLWSPSSLAIQQTTAQRLPQNMDGDAVALISAPISGSGGPRQLVMVGSQFSAGSAQIQASQLNPWNPELPVVLSTTPTLPTALSPGTTDVSGQSSASVLTLASTVGTGTAAELLYRPIDGFTGQLSYAQASSISLPSNVSNTSVSVLPTRSTSAGSANVNLVLAGNDASADLTGGSVVQTSTIASPWTPTFVQDSSGAASPSVIANLGNIALINTSAKDLLVMAVNVDAQGSITSGSSLYSNVFDQTAITALVTQVPGTNSQYLGAELSNTNIAILSSDSSSDAANSNGQALIGAGINTSADGFLVQTSLFTPGGSQVKSIQSAIVQERPASLTLSADQTASTLIPVGDLNGDGYADLLVTANNVLVQTGVNSQSLGTGLRLISGAGTSSQIESINNPTLLKQAVQVAASFSLGGSTPVARRTGPSQLTLSSLGPSQQLASSIVSPGTATYALQSSADVTSADSFLASNLATAYNLFLQGATPTVGAPSLLAAASLAAGSTSGSFGDLNADGRPDYFSPDPDQAILFDAYGKPWQVWAARAAGDVNGNGTDDVLLTLLPIANANDLYEQLVAYLDVNITTTFDEGLKDYLEALKRGVKEFVVSLDPALQPVLLDGALFKVRDDSFAFTDLRVPLNPTGGLRFQPSETIGLPSLNPFGVSVLADRGDAGETVLLAASTDYTIPPVNGSPETVGGAAVTRLADLINPWSSVDRRASQSTPALVRQGNNVYMAVQGGGGETSASQSIHWTASTDGGLTWGSWAALPAQFGDTSTSPATPVFVATNKPVSLAVVNNTLYLSYIEADSNDLYITSLGLAEAFSNNWSTPYQIPGQSATYATLTTETINGVQQLAVYYVSNDATNRILKAYSSNPGNSETWTSDVELYYDYDASDLTGGLQTASGPIAAAQAFGRTYLAFQGGTTASPSTEIYLSTNGDTLNNGNTWTTQALLDPGIATGVGLTTTAEGLSLSYVQSSQPGSLEINLLQQENSSLGTLQSALISSEPLPVQLSNNVALSYGSAGTDGNPQMLLVGINAADYGNLVQTSVIDQWSSFELQPAVSFPSGSLCGSRPLLARAGNVIYMVSQIRGSTTLCWSSSVDGGESWTDWQNLPAAITSDLLNIDSLYAQSLSLAVFNGTLRLSYVTSANGIAITALTDPEANNWGTPLIVPGNAYSYATLASELVDGVEQLAVYAVAADGSNAIRKSYSSTPTNSASWTLDVPILSSGGTALTSPGALAVSPYQGRTYLAWQGGSAASSGNAIVLATSPANGLNSGADWTAQTVTDPGSAANLGLSSSPRGLLLSYALESGSGLILTNLSPAEASSGPLDPLQSWIQTGGGAGSLAGYSIDGNVDLNGDGLSDLLISDPAAIAAGSIGKDDPTGRASTDANAGTQYALFGGDWLGIASKVGTANDDTLVGTPLADVIYSLQGNDQVSSRGGGDVIYTGDGDDAIAIIDNAFLRIDGGGGFNSLLLQGQTDQAFDFRLGVGNPQFFSGTKLRNINLINSSGYGNNTLSFDAAAVNALNTTRILFLVPDAGDTIALSPGFSRSPDLDASVQGLYWNAFADTSAAGSTASGNPTLIYVLNPLGVSGNGWLNTQVTSLEGAQPAAFTPVPAAETSAFAAGPLAAPVTASAPLGAVSAGVLPSGQPTSTRFGDGLWVDAYPSDSASSQARFVIRRDDTSGRQLVAYGPSSLNSQALPGLDYTLATGVCVFQPGESARTILVPLKRDSLARRNPGTLSLELRPIADRGQQEMHALIDVQAGSANGITPVLSAAQLQLDPSGTTARLGFRADTNSLTTDDLLLNVALRASADALASTRSAAFSIRDFSDDNRFAPLKDPLQSLPLDRDGRVNRQVSAELQFQLDPSADGERVVLLGPDLRWQTSVRLLEGDQVFFEQEAPLTCWRSDSGAGLVSVGLRAGDGSSQTLLRDARGGSPGSLNAARVWDADPSNGWLSTEGKAIGSRAEVAMEGLSAQPWIPFASRDGRELPLLGVSLEGNQVTARFAEGVTAVFWQASGTAPAQVVSPAALEVQRLGGFDNAIALHTVDGITGEVAGLLPGQEGYLPAALARAEQEGLLLGAEVLPEFGQSARFDRLALDTSKRYGLLVLPDGDRGQMFSSFAAANPDGNVHVLSLASSTDTLVLGIEDLSQADRRSDGDYNDMLLRFIHVEVGLL